MVRAREGDALGRPEQPHYLDLFIDAPAAGGEIGAKSLEFRHVPADADSETKSSAAQDVDLRGLLCHNGRLPLRQNKNSRDELE